MTSIGKHIDKVGIFGSLFAALCCLGVPAVVTAASAIGLGFVINDATLMPMMGVSLAVILIGLGFGFRHHHKPWPLGLAVLGGALLALSAFVWHARPPAYMALALLVAASVLNVVLARPRRTGRGLHDGFPSAM